MADEEWKLDDEGADLKYKMEKAGLRWTLPDKLGAVDFVTETDKGSTLNRAVVSFTILIAAFVVALMVAVICWMAGAVSELKIALPLFFFVVVAVAGYVFVVRRVSGGSSPGR
ncbi:hypothetical protein EJC51_20515 [Streptomyces aquilus]|uniref:Uncharacterized protein n=1 Tax=Streptomyces aquilus TaxID=2548456 RepID=A0A3Q9BZD3_9ACTN|nr:hypothetical protein [Streptomyces aquilus]AZP18261.1 hypothetical protein EJC51_20515 [Streptomyces aquilus]